MVFISMLHVCRFPGFSRSNEQDDPRVALQRLSSEVHDELGFKLGSPGRYARRCSDTLWETNIAIEHVHRNSWFTQIYSYKNVDFP